MKGIFLENVSSNELLDLLQEIKERLERVENGMTAKANAATPEGYLTAKQVAEKFNITLSTLWHWSKKRILTKYTVGKRVYYKESEVQKAFDNGKVGV